jgi:uncharacterized membrane protein
MNRLLAAYAASALVLISLEALWIGVLAKSLYQQGIGHLMAENPRMGVALLFYVVYVAGLLLFVVVPNAQDGAWGMTLLHGALFGLVAYATYDLSNLATLKDWPLAMSLIDIAWGAFASCVAAGAGKAALNWVARSA